MNHLPFDFTVNKETSTVHVKKEFDAKPDLVWDAFTKPEILDQWWAPKPWLSKTKLMEFKEGGRRIYAMVGPEGEEHWALADYTSISPKTNFRYSDAFCDEEGNVSNEVPRSDWNIDFTDKGNVTAVNIVIKYKTLTDLETIIGYGFKEGFTMAMNNLDEIFTNFNNQ
ncbi:MAG: SRPBCC domain-containing protein [Bacteroidota bacterium]